MNNKMWGILVHLSMHYGFLRYETLPFDDEMWEKVLQGAKDAGLNTIVVDLCDGVQYASHPEISMPGAWSHGRVRKELARCKELGITLIPKLNFSTGHRMWLGQYGRMISTPEYYRVCADLIREIYELFEEPEYIQIGMDEETRWVCELADDLVVYRKGKLLWHDLRFLLDCVHDTGAKPWIWSDILFEQTEDFQKYIDPDELVVSPWYYNAFKEEHFTPLSKMDPDGTGEHSRNGLKYIEQIPQKVRLREVAGPLMKAGYSYVPTGSVYWRNDYNMPEMVEYFEAHAPKKEQILGYLTAHWKAMLPQNKEEFDESFRVMKAVIGENHG